MVGPEADNPEQLFGDYSPDYDPVYTKTPAQGLQDLATQTNVAAGCNDMHCDNYDAQSVLNALTDTELIFICVGTGIF